MSGILFWIWEKQKFLPYRRNFCDMAEISVILSENVLFWLKSGSNAIITNIRKMRNFILDILIQKFLRYGRNFCDHIFRLQSKFWIFFQLQRKMMIGKHVQNFILDILVQKFLRYDRNFCTPIFCLQSVFRLFSW